MSSVRSMVVNVGANVAPYVAGMRSAQVATGQFAASTTAATTGARKMGAGLGMMSPKLLGPAGLVFGLKAASGASIDLQSSALRLQTQIGLTAAEADELSTAARQIGVAYGVGGQAATDASFFIASAGLRGKDATDALERSAQAAALGLGETATIADLVTSAMNAYGPEVLNAADATDILLGTVQAGKAEAAELAASMGSVLPVASAMGVSFDQVGGGMGAMTRTGSSAAESSTQLTAIMSGLLKPTDDAEKALNEMGMTSQGLRDQIADGGLLDVLMQLAGAMDGNDAAMARVFPNIRALRGVLDLMGASAETTADIFGQVANASGLLDEGLKTLDTESARFEIDQLTANVSAFFATIGDTTTGPIKETTGALNDMFDAGRKLNELSAADKVSNWDTFGATIRAIGGDTSMWADIMDTAGQEADLLAAATQRQGEAAARSENMGRGYRHRLDETAEATDNVTAATERTIEALDNYVDALRATTDPVFGLLSAVESAEAAQDEYTAAVKEFGEGSDEAQAAAFNLAGTLVDLEARALDGDLSFTEFERQLDRWVDQGRLTAAQADTMRERVAELTGVTEDYEGDYDATINANTREAEARLREVSRLLASIPRRISTTLFLDASSYNQAIARAGATGTLVARESGGPVWPGQPFLVGERGPELVTFPSQGTVTPANQTAVIQRGGDGAAQGGFTLQVYGQPDSETLRRARDQARITEARRRQLQGAY